MIKVEEQVENYVYKSGNRRRIFPDAIEFVKSAGRRNPTILARFFGLNPIPGTIAFIIVLLIAVAIQGWWRKRQDPRVPSWCAVFDLGILFRSSYKWASVSVGRPLLLLLLLLPVFAAIAPSVFSAPVPVPLAAASTFVAPVVISRFRDVGRRAKPLLHAHRV